MYNQGSKAIRGIPGLSRGKCHEQRACPQGEISGDKVPHRGVWHTRMPRILGENVEYWVGSPGHHPSTQAFLPLATKTSRTTQALLGNGHCLGHHCPYLQGQTDPMGIFYWVAVWSMHADMLKVAGDVCLVDPWWNIFDLVDPQTRQFAWWTLTLRY